MKRIDLRSDTVTKPTPAMREAMAAAEVGDDVYGEDPTVNRLQAAAAGRLGMEASLFVPSGSMANLCAVLAQTRPGDEVLIERTAHTFHFESAGCAAFAGVQFNTLPGSRGVLDIAETEAAIRPKNHHFGPTRLILVENTHNMAGGAIYPLDKLSELREMADRHGLRIHMDGARLWNAAIASGVPADRYAACCDSVSFCLSKGLGAPVGSLVCGSAEFVDRCHRYRKMLGGGMRQAGVLAAAGLHALEHHVERLAEDHANARLLAEELHPIDGLVLDGMPETNMVFFQLREGRPGDFVARAKDRGLLVSANPFGQIRAVTHLDVTADEVRRAAGVAAEVLAEKRP